MNKYRETLRNLGPEVLNSLPQLAKELTSDFPDVAASLIVEEVLLRRELWAELRSSDTRPYLRLADAQDCVLQAIATCGEHQAYIAALNVLLDVKQTIEADILSKLIQVLDFATPYGAKAEAILRAASIELDGLDPLSRLEQPLHELVGVVQRAAVSYAPPERRERLNATADGLRNGFEQRYAIHARDALLMADSAGMIFILGLLALVYMKDGKPVPMDGFWAGEAIFCRGGLVHGKRFLFRNLRPAATADVIDRVLGRTDPITRGMNFANLLFNSRVMPIEALPHLLTVLRTPDEKERSYFLGSECFQRCCGQWDPPSNALTTLAQEVDRMGQDLYEVPSGASDPRLWQLAGAVEVLAGVAMACSEQAVPSALINYLKKVVSRLDTIWPQELSSMDWNPMSALYKRCEVHHPAHVVKFALACLGSKEEATEVGTTDWGYRVKLASYRFGPPSRAKKTTGS